MKHFSKRSAIVFLLTFSSALASADCVGLLCSSYDYSMPVHIATSTGNAALTVNGGKVGFGTTAPQFTLHVVGNIATNGFGDAGTLVLRSAAGTDDVPTSLPEGSAAGALSFRGYDGTDYQRLAVIRSVATEVGGISSTSSAGALTFLTTPIGALEETEKMRITSDGKVGIGTDTPSEALDVAGRVKAIEICIGTDCRSAWPSSGGGVTPISEGGTGQTTAEAALNALLPSQSGNAGKFLKTDGSTVSWQAAGSGSGSGSVTSVDVSVPSFMSSSGGPITTSGTIALGFVSQGQRTVFAGPTSGTGAPEFRALNINDITSASTGPWLAASGGCPAGEGLQYNSISDKLACGPSQLTQAQIANALGFMPQAPGQFVLKSGDAMTGHLSVPTLMVGSTPLLMVNSNGVGAGLYPNGSGSLQALGSIVAQGHLGQSMIGQMVLRSSDGTMNSPTALPMTSAAGVVSFRGYDGSTYQRLGAVRVQAADAAGVTSSSSAGTMLLSTTSPGQTTESEKVRITADGKVGIGSNSPTEKLDVAGNVKAAGYCIGSSCITSWPTGTGNFVSKAGDTMTGALNLPDDGLKIGTNQLVATGGKVGIGTGSPAAKLDVNGEVKFGNTSSTCSGTTEGQQRYNSTSKQMEFCNGTKWSSTRVHSTRCTYSTGTSTAGGNYYNRTWVAGDCTNGVPQATLAYNTIANSQSSNGVVTNAYCYPAYGTVYADKSANNYVIECLYVEMQ